MATGLGRGHSGRNTEPTWVSCVSRPRVRPRGGVCCIERLPLGIFGMACTRAERRSQSTLPVPCVCVYDSS